jgi:hypothetical protein
MNYPRHIKNFKYCKSIVLFTLVVLLNSFSAGQAKACNYLSLQDCPTYWSCAIKSLSTSNSRINKLSAFLTSENHDRATCNKKTKELEAKIKERFKLQSLEKRKEIQLRLQDLNFYYDTIDGLYGPKTFQGFVEFVAHGYLETEKKTENDPAYVVDKVVEQIAFFPDLIPLFIDFNKIRTASQLKKKKQIYRGELLDDLPHGHGYMQYEDGTWYLGQWNNGKKHGKGLMSFTDDSYYSGDWQVGLITGEGLILYPNEEAYFGSLRNGLKNGQGILRLEKNLNFSTIWQDGNPIEKEKGPLKHCSASFATGCTKKELCKLATADNAKTNKWPNSPIGLELQKIANEKDYQCFKSENTPILKAQTTSKRQNVPQKKTTVTEKLPPAENTNEPKRADSLKDPVATVLENPTKILETLTDEQFIPEAVKEFNQLLFNIINPEK